MTRLATLTRQRQSWASLLVVTLCAVATPHAQQAAPTPLTASERALAFTRLARPYTQETIELKLAPGEGMEYKYRMDKGGTFVFSWVSTETVHYELHSEPDGAPRGFAESFDTSDSAGLAHGIYDALFTGIHGWYWENRSARDVTITLKTSGSYDESREFRRGRPVAIKRFE